MFSPSSLSCLLGCLVLHQVLGDGVRRPLQRRCSETFWCFGAFDLVVVMDLVSLWWWW
jgi:hypothetical protein